MNLKPAYIDMPLHTKDCTRVASDNTPLIPTHPLPNVVGVRLDSTGRNAYLYELPDTTLATWKNRKMLCLVFKLDGLLFHWKTYSENGRVYGLNTQYHLHFYWAKRDFNAFEEWTANPTHMTSKVRSMYLTYRPNTDIEEVPF